MKPLNCVILEDQIPAQKTLMGYIAQVPTLSLLNTYISPLEALQELNSNRVDILFLDIHLPKVSGIELLRSLQQPPQIILTTAFPEYAIEGFELDVVDYLLKPFSFERFLKSVSKIKQKGSRKPGLQQDFLFVRNKGQIKKIAIADIEYVEAKGDFTIICTSSNREVANISLQNILVSLGDRFVRCHKSYVVNIDRIDRIVGNDIFVGPKRVAIGRTFKEALMARIRMI